MGVLSRQGKVKVVPQV